MKKENVNTSINAKMPFISFLAINYNIPVITEVQEWFESCIIRSYANPMAEMQIMVSDDAEIKKSILLLLTLKKSDLNKSWMKQKPDRGMKIYVSGTSSIHGPGNCQCEKTGGD